MTKPGQIATFYSFKGGVGRSFALANVAVSAARWGARVLCIDWDIEAPGLDHYFAPFITTPAPGLVDLIGSYSPGVVDRLPWENHLTKLDLKDGTTLHLITAGMAGAEYAAKVHALDWPALYGQGLGYALDAMAESMRDRYDLILIDSRTGVTEFGGIVTAQIPDVLVCFFTANEQSIAGIDYVASRSGVVRDGLPLARSRLVVVPVTSRFDHRVERERSDKWRAVVADRLGKFVVDWVARGIDPNVMLNMLTVPYEPFWSFGEELAVLHEPRSLDGGIEDVCETIAALLIKQFDHTAMLARSRGTYLAAGRRAALRLHAEPVGVIIDGGTQRDRELLSDACIRAGLKVWSGDAAAIEDKLALAAILLTVWQSPGKRHALDIFLAQSMEDDRTRPILHLQRFGDANQPDEPGVEVLTLSAINPSTADGVARRLQGLLSRGTSAGNVVASGNPATQLSEGDLAIQQGDVRRAIEAFRAELDWLRQSSEADGSDMKLQLRSLEVATKLGDALISAGTLPDAFETFQTASHTAPRLVPKADRARWQGLQLRLQQRVGDVLVAQGDLAGALLHYQSAIATADRLAAAEPDSQEWGLDRTSLLRQIGDVFAFQGDLEGSYASYQAAMVIATNLAATNTGNAAWQRDLSISHLKIGDMLAAQGDGTGALAAYRAGMTIAERLAAIDPGNSAWQRDLSISHERIGDMLAAQGDGTGALAAYRAGMTIAERLAAIDPGNAAWQRGLSISHERTGNTLAAQGDGTGALAAYRAGMAIRERLAATDPGNAAWQRDLSINHLKIGDMLAAQGDGTDALAAYRAGMTIAERLAASDPGNSAWQRDLSISHLKIGDMLAAQGDGTGALAAYRAGMTIAERLASTDPGNAAWQRDLSISHQRIGDMLAAQGDGTGALAAYRAGMTIAERLAVTDPGNATWQRDLSISHNRIGNMLAAQGDGTGALAAYRADMTIAERLAATDPGNAAWQRDLSISHERIGDMLAAQGDGTGALATYRAGMTIRERLAATDPGNAAWQRDVFVSLFKLTTLSLSASDRSEACRFAQRLNEQANLLAARFPQDPQRDDYPRAAAQLLKDACGPTPNSAVNS